MLSLIVGFGSLASCTPNERQPSAENAVLRAPIAGRKVSSAYLRILNPGDKKLVLESVHSTQAGAIEIHENREVDGQMRMRRLSSVEIPANGSLNLKPGGLHLMLFRLELSGEPFDLQLRFSDGSVIQTIAVIEEL